MTPWLTPRLAGPALLRARVDALPLPEPRRAALRAWVDAEATGRPAGT